MNPPLIIGNWKCNPLTFIEAKKLLTEINEKTEELENINVVICPPFIYLKEFVKKELRIKIGAQDCFWERKGAFTGEVSSEMLKNLGCSYVIIGHSERRNYFGETNEIIGRKLKSVIEARLFPILCIGETKEEREKEETIEILRDQLKGALEIAQREKLSFGNLIITYEPVWAISANSNGESCCTNEAMQNMLFIRKELIKNFGEVSAKSVKILYGGSVDSENVAGYIEAGFEGVLVGSASLKTGEFVKIVKNAEANIRK